MSRIYRDIVCRTCNDTFVVDHSIDDPFQCSECQLDAINEQTSKEEYDAFKQCVAHADSCGADLDNDLLADMKEQLDAANESSEFWHQQAMAGWVSVAQLKYALVRARRPWYKKLGTWLNEQWRYNIYNDFPPQRGKCD